ncbi:methionine--tRNA ligase [candidate division WWE3 bacterium CG_4_10_14_0_2_um_filter_47_8]|nr:MAG: methionine--tRNA ligase [candidate division WWE3 bacterium CG_4_10_14_0_2_um_filter_47_8]
MTIPFSDFQKIELRIGKVENVEEVEGLDKLYKLTVDLGEREKRTLLAGLKESHQPYELLGKLIVVIANLEPREIGGVRSEGMLLAAISGEKPIILIPEEEVKPGSKVC